MSIELYATHVSNSEKFTEWTITGKVRDGVELKPFDLENTVQKELQDDEVFRKKFMEENQ